MDPNQWNSYYGHPASGALPSVHPSLNRLDLTTAGLSHQFQAGRGVPSLQAVNYQALSGLPILDSLSPLTSGLSAQGHQLVFNSPTNRIASDPQTSLAAQSLTSPHQYESTSIGEVKSVGSRVPSENLGRNQLLEAARVWSGSAANFTSPTSLYNQFNAALFPQPVEVSAPAGHVSISPVLKSSQNQSVQQPHHYLQEPPPAHSSNVSASSRLPVVQRPPEHSMQAGTPELVFSNSRSTPASSQSATQASRTHQYTTHKAVVLGVGSNPFVQNLHRQTPVQQQQQQRQSHNHQQQQHGGYQQHTRGGAQDLSSGTSQSNLYGSYANLSSESQNFVNSASHHHQHINTGDVSYEAVSPAPPLQHQRQQQQPVSDISGHHQTLSLQLGQFSDLSSLTPDQASALAEKFQMDSRMQSNHQQQIHHSDIPGRSALSLQRQQASATPSLKIPSQQHQQQLQGTASEASHFQGRVMTESQSLSQMLSAGGRHTPGSQQQTLSTSSNSLLNTPVAPSPIQAMADSTTKPKRSRSRKKKVETAPLPVITPVASNSSGHSLALPQLHQQQQTAVPPSPSDMNQSKKSNLPHSHMQQQPLSQPGLEISSPSPHISTLSMAPTNSPQQSSYATVRTPSAPQNFSLNEHQHQVFQQNSLKPSQHNAAEIQQQAEFARAPSTYKQAKKSAAKSKTNVSAARRQQPQASPAFPQLADQRRVSGYTSEQQQQQKQGSEILSSSHMSTADGSYSKLLGQGQIFLEGVAYDHLQQPDHLLDEEESSSQQQQQHFQLDFDSQPFMDQLAAVPAPPSSSGYGSEVILTSLNAQDESVSHAGSALDANSRSLYQVDDMRPVALYTEQQHGDLAVNDVAFGMFSQDSQQTSLQEETPPVSEPEMTLTFVPQVVEDDELGHLATSSLSEPVPMLPKQQQNQPRVPSGPGASFAPPNDSFQNSFLSYLQGHKQETLSSVSSSAVTKKPQLPKYIPEPPRPKPPPPPPTSDKPTVSKDSSSFSSSTGGITSKRLGDAISTFADSASQKSASEKEGYSVQRTSDLAVKITLPKTKSKSRFGPFAESTLLKDSMQKNRERKKKRGKLSDSEEDFFEDSRPVQKKRPPPREKTPPPTRTSIGRKAKDKCLEMTKQNRDASDSDDDFGFGAAPSSKKSKAKGYKSDDSLYNSDEDPAWKPFDVDLNQGDVVEKRKKPRRQRARLPSVPKVSKPGGKGNTVTRPGQSSNAAGHLKVGTYMIEKKDLHNSESYPIWRMEENNLMKKFELKKGDAGRVKHVATGILSTWMPSMEKQFQTIKVREVEMKERGGVLAVEVLEEFRPFQGDAKSDNQHDDDPLVDPFSIYLQVFLSQALEPNFLTVIKETNETFYLDALDSIDGMIEKKCKEITKLARWEQTFKEALHRCPLMKEIDRPNLKQPCQASEFGSPPCIKSVFLSGLPYDRFLLTEKPMSGTNNPQEFMIGKVAAHYVRTYHSLYHFKYWLRQRCDAKVKMTKESNKSENLQDETILDKCLENRNWVLQLLDNLKNLLRGDETL
ncbi:proline-rich protein 12 [Elysia marginata]|uniref:Proline-rich protein 12 n=1 Tax=Elysia marginata TaxID=1093978 RepID=A0AAV4ICR1_9GAST|nr:proline-rich protein 12 [Elysia marginata]